MHGRDVYSKRAAALVREIASLVDEKTSRALAELLISEYNESSKPDVAKLENVLAEMRDDAVLEAKRRGFEV
jgi:hypothetical protein